MTAHGLTTLAFPCSQQQRKLLSNNSLVTFSTQTAKMSRTSTRPAPMKVRICGYCHTDHRLDCAGHLSLSHMAWYCSPSCYQLRRLTNGEPMTKEQIRVLCQLRKQHFPVNDDEGVDVLKKNKERTQYLLKTRRIRQVIDKEIRREVGDDESTSGDQE